MSTRSTRLRDGRRGRVRSLSRAALISTWVLAIAGALLTGARAQDDAALADDVVPVDPTVGSQVEAVLATVGMDAAWRSATGLHDVTRAMTVSYVGDDQAVVDDLLATVGQLGSNLDQHERVTGEVRRAAVFLAAAREHEREATIEYNRATAHLQGVVALVQSVAVDLFAGTGDSADELLGSDGQALVQAQRTMELQGHTLEEMLERRDLAIARLTAADDALARAQESVVEATAAHTDLVDEAAALLRTRVQLEDTIRGLIPTAAGAFVLADVPRVPELTPRAVDAYVRAELAMAEINPRCRVSWRTLGAIGGVEGAHGTYGGRSMEMSGRPSDAIVGLALDGVSVDNYGDVLANIRDTDGGRYDGDTVYDRAVGPMQFIPQTWELWKADGDGDGAMEPQDLDDAALAAAGYVCNYGSHSRWDNWIASVFAYNHSPAYVNSVQSRLVQMQRVALPAVEGYELWPSRPYGTFEPLPIPEPEPTEGVEELLTTDG